jgi:hypothetical protein
MRREIKVLTDAERRSLSGTKVSLHFKLTNPHKGMFVVKVLPGTKVLGYLDAAVLENCTMRIHPAARRKIADGANRSVHAWIVGVFRYVASVELWKLSPSDSELHYNPTKGDQGFTTSAPSIADRRVITTAKAILFWQKHIYLLKG